MDAWNYTETTIGMRRFEKLRKTFREKPQRNLRTSWTDHGFGSQAVSACIFNPSVSAISHNVAIVHDVTAPEIPAWKTRFPAPQ